MKKFLLNIGALLLVCGMAYAAAPDTVTTPEGITARKITMPDGQKCVVAYSELGSMNSAIGVDCDWRGLKP